VNEYDGPGADQIQEKKTDDKERGNYHFTDWTEEIQAVEESEDIFRDAGRSDLLPWLRDWREAVARLQADFRERLTYHASLSLFIEVSLFKAGISVRPFIGTCSINIASTKEMKSLRS